MSEWLTVGEIFDKLERMKKPNIPCALMHHGTAYGVYEFDLAFWDEFIKYYEQRITLVASGLDEVTPGDRFITMILNKAY